jgi:hypothetical protein
VVETGPARSAQNRLATIRLPNAGPTTSLKSAKSRLYECRLLADFRPAVGPAFGSRMVAKRFCADRVFSRFDNFKGILKKSKTFDKIR